MGTFEDLQGEEWTPRVTVATVLRYDARTGKRLLRDFLSVVQRVSAELGDESQPSASYAATMIGVVEKLCGDLESLFALVYCSVQDQAEQRGVTFEQFVDRLGGEQVAEAGRIVGGLVADFFQRAAGGLSNLAPATSDLSGTGPSRGSMRTSTASPQSAG